MCARVCAHTHTHTHTLCWDCACHLIDSVGKGIPFSLPSHSVGRPLCRASSPGHMRSLGPWRRRQAAGVGHMESLGQCGPLLTGSQVSSRSPRPLGCREQWRAAGLSCPEGETCGHLAAHSLVLCPLVSQLLKVMSEQRRTRQEEMQAVAAPGADDPLGGPRPLGGPSCWQCGAVGSVHVLPCLAGSVVSGRTGPGLPIFLSIPGTECVLGSAGPWLLPRTGLCPPPHPPPREQACLWWPGERVASLLCCSSL